MTTKTTHDDAVAIALASNRLGAIVRRMTNTLFRSGRSGVLNTARDFSCCIVSARHELLMAADSLPIHVMSGPELIGAKLVEQHPLLTQGDAFLHNSPYDGNSHAADHCLVVPVVDGDDVHRFTAIVKAHQADCGNSQPTTYMSDAVDVYHEGALLFPMVQVQRGYDDIADIVRMCEQRIRVPAQWRGDYLAMVGAARIGERELLALGEEVGWEQLERHLDGWLDYSERRMVAALERIPSGSSSAESVHDPVPAAPDGIPIRATVTVHGGEGRIEVDLRDNPDCLPNGLNLSESCARTAAYIGVFNSIDHSVPHNAGSFRRIDVRLRRNCIAGIPEHPTSTSVATTNIADHVINSVQRALAEHQDGIGMAEFGSVVAPSAAVISGRDERHGDKPFVNQVFLMLTAGAAGPVADGWLTAAHAGNGGMLFYDSVEVDERSYPLVVRERSIVPDSEGAGTFRGAPSARVEYGPVPGGRLRVMYYADGTVNPARGARGGGDGGPSRQWRRAADGELSVLEPFADVLLAPGETVVCCTTGGGGYGRPGDRAVDAVLADVREGWVSAERAASTYGVVVDPSGHLDATATESLRKDDA
ncbi:hydantoinase B/oxoprolinase family protein [Conexibacter woesei]|uniref:Hydantoinase B/oxoprolinase n=1 Tax=Conexibacter woesei (strain DSM 14684 / CCUG 47730 / CIP 108061 / JCM 11494 / NBRC 100937 / ID131577) TaxID=469383 RepID=D3F704_CONWI|nr:hydantoinase B/oxoprolinase family protein [Conexibacter woesei]ADB52802.1 Hydantoinase B/oxoprolinase [Conexibacter woesei DSM 14684]